MAHSTVQTRHRRTTEPIRDGFSVNRLVGAAELAWEQSAPIRASFRGNRTEFLIAAERDSQGSADWTRIYSLDPACLAMQLMAPGEHPSLDWQRLPSLRTRFKLFRNFLERTRGRGFYRPAGLRKILDELGVEGVLLAYAPPLFAPPAVSMSILGSCDPLFAVYKERAAAIGYSHMQFRIAADFIRTEGGVRRRTSMRPA